MKDRSKYLIVSLAVITCSAGLLYCWKFEQRKNLPEYRSIFASKSQAREIQTHGFKSTNIPKEKTVRKEVRQMTSAMSILQSQSSLPMRFYALSNLIGRLTTAEIEELCGFLVSNQKLNGVSDSYLASLKNSIINRLARENNSAELIQQSLLDIQSDATQAIVMRDYAIQHLGARYEGEHSYPDARASRQAFWNSSLEDKETLAATSLLALHRINLKDNLPQEEKVRLMEHAMSLAKDFNVGEPTRMAALEILRNSKSDKALTIAKEIIMGNRSLPLTSVAVATLGDLGNMADANWLKDHASNSKALSLIVNNSIKKIHLRNN